MIHVQRGTTFSTMKGLCAGGDLNNVLWNNVMQTIAAKVEVVDGPIYVHLHPALMLCFEFPHYIIFQLLATLKFK